MTTATTCGHLAHRLCKKSLVLCVLHTRAGFYLGTQDADGFPVSRESVEYWPSQALADRALANGGWTQKQDV